MVPGLIREGPWRLTYKAKAASFHWRLMAEC